MGSLEKGPVFAANNDNGQEENVDAKEQYFDLIYEYDKKFTQIKNLTGRRENPRVEETIQRLDQERHELHLRLVEAGQKIGKNEYDILADIMERSGNLEEFGLPEFSIMTHHESSFFVGSEVKQDEVVLVFDTVYFGGDRRKNQKDALYPPDETIRQSRAKALAEALGTSIALLKDSRFFHSHTMDRTGVILKTSQIEETLALIRSNPEKYRLGEKSYSPDEIDGANAHFQQHCKELWNYWAADKYRSYVYGEEWDGWTDSEREEEYDRLVSERVESVEQKIEASIQEDIEKIRRDFGERAASVAQKAYQDWRTDREK
jgi:hypothetical protein